MAVPTLRDQALVCDYMPVMLQAFTIRSPGRLVAIEPDAVRATLGERKGPCWVDLTAATDEELLGWFEAFGVPEFVAEQVLSHSLAVAPDPLSGRGTVLPDAALLVLPVMDGEGADSVDRVVAICVPGGLITYHAKPHAALAAGIEVALRGDILPSATVSGLVSVLTRFWASRCVFMGTALGQRLAVLASRLRQADEVGEDDLTGILDCDESLQTLAAVVDEQLAGLRALETANTSVLDLQPLASHFGVGLRNLDGLSRSIDRLQWRANSLRAQYDSRLAERTNGRLATLTVLSAVFMPLTLIAGIYGMNFDHMPELHTPHGYGFALGAMGATAALMLLFFWRRGWFD